MSELKLDPIVEEDDYIGKGFSPAEMLSLLQAGASKGTKAARAAGVIEARNFVYGLPDDSLFKVKMVDRVFEIGKGTVVKASLPEKGGRLSQVFYDYPTYFGGFTPIVPVEADDPLIPYAESAGRSPASKTRN